MSTIASDLSPGLWNALYERIRGSRPGSEIVIATVSKRDESKKLIWVEELGDVSIPLVSFDFEFDTYDTQADGSVSKRDGTSNALQRVRVLTPRVGQLVAILQPNGIRRFPMCLGCIQSQGFWEGE
jgi:hypothetical protein